MLLDLVIKWTQPFAQFVYPVSIAAGRRVGWDAQCLSDGLECHVFPQFQVNDGALFGGQFRQCCRQVQPKRGIIGVVTRGEHRIGFSSELIIILLSRRTSPHQINGLIVCETDQECAWLCDIMEQMRMAAEFEEKLLQYITGVSLLSGEIQEKRKQGLCVVVIKRLQVVRRGHLPVTDASANRICLH